MAIDGTFYSNISVDEKLDLSAIQVSINYPSEYGGTVIDSATAYNNKLDIYLDGNQVRHLNLFAVESSIDIKDSSVTSSIINHNASYKLQTGWFRRLYLYKELKNADGTTHVPKDENDDTIPYHVGPQLASQVLSSALSLSGAGISLAWSAPDYYITNKRTRSKMFDTSITGLIDELISPLQFTERYAIYYYVRDTVLYVKKMNASGSGEVPTYDISDFKITGGISIKKSIILKPKVKKVIIEYYEEKDPDLSAETNIETERAYDSNGLLIGTTTNSTTTICDVITSETEKVFRTLVSATTGNQAGATLYPVSESITTYTYDVPPTELDSDGLFQPYRNLIYKRTTAKQYVFPNLAKEVFRETITNIAYGYNQSKELISEVETTEHYNNAEELVKTTKSVTTHTQCADDTVDIKRSDYEGDEFLGMISVQRAGKLQSSARVPENDADNSNWELKYTSVSGNGGTYDRVEKISSDVLSLSQLTQAAHEIIRDGSCVQVSVTMNLVPVAWITKGTQIGLTGTISGTWFDSEGNKHNTTLDLSELVDTSLVVESQSIEITGESLLGSMSLVGYKYFTSSGGGFDGT